MTEVLSVPALNRALLARQHLLQRESMSAEAAVEHLVGLQAQEPLEPYVGLWSRLQGFQPTELAESLIGRSAVRTPMMRRTIHLLTARDALAMRPLHQQMLVSRMLSTLRRQLPGVDLDELADLARPTFANEPRTAAAVARELVDRWPSVAPRYLGDALTSLLPLVQVPPRGIWGENGPARQTTMQAWLSRPLADPGMSRQTLVLRYLAAYGPAASADIRAWSGLTGIREAIAPLRRELRTFRDERGRELFDVPDGPLPDPGTPAPPRFLPAFDNAVLGYDDRSRLIDDDHRKLSVEGARFVLVDGRVAATWTSTRDGDSARLHITPLRLLGPHERAAITREGECLLAFLTDCRGHHTVELVEP